MINFYDYNFAHKKVFLRVDINVPLHHGVIVDDHRLQAIVPTLNYILQHGGMIILATHLGRPHGYDAQLSTQQLLPWFVQRNYQIKFESDLHNVAPLNFEPNNIILLENLRFFPGEQHPTQEFAQQLAACADCYVNDAFAVLHRNNCSVTLLPQLFNSDDRMFGPLVMQELASLNTLLQQPRNNFVLIMGGGKVASKLPMINKLLHKVDTLLLCPALVFTFLQQQNKKVGKSLVEVECFNDIKELLKTAQQVNTKILFPIDYLITHQTNNGLLEVVNADNISDDSIGISIGPETINLWSPTLDKAQTIFINAGMGFLSRPETLRYTKQLLKKVAATTAYKVIGGGETVAIAQQEDLTKKFDVVSTGGGATLAYLAQEEMPGLVAMKQLKNRT